MAGRSRNWLTAGVDSSHGQARGYPFRGPGKTARAMPFLVVALFAEASLALPPAPSSWWPVAVSVVLLALTGLAFALPWTHLPSWATVVPPLAYCGSALALILAAGPASGIGVVILVPLIWTVLFHHSWESACVVAAIVAVETTVSLTPVAAGGAVIARRVALWALLGTVLAVAAHGLRERITRSQNETVRLQERLRQVTVLEDRDRIAGDLHNRVISRLFSAGMSLQGALPLISDTAARERVQSTVRTLDHAARELRNTIFGLMSPEHRTSPLKDTILELSRLRNPAALVSFTGSVDERLTAPEMTRLTALLREAMVLTAPHSAPARIDVLAAGEAVTVAIELTPVRTVSAGESKPSAVPDLPDLQASAAAANVSLEMAPAGGGAVVLRWCIGIGVAESREPTSSTG